MRGCTLATPPRPLLQDSSCECPLLCLAALGHPLSRWPAFAAHLVIELHRVPVGRGAVPTSTAGGTGAQGQGDGEGDGEGSQAEEEQGRVGDEEAQGLLVQAGQQQAEVEELAEGDWEGEEEDVQAERERRAEEGEAAGGEHGEEGRVMEGRAVKEGASGGPSRSVGRLRRLLRWEELHGGLREWGRGWSRGGRRQGCCHGLRQRRLQQLGIEAEVAQDGDSWGGTNSRQQDGQVRGRVLVRTDMWWAATCVGVVSPGALQPCGAYLLLAGRLSSAQTDAEQCCVSVNNLTRRTRGQMFGSGAGMLCP